MFVQYFNRIFKRSSLFSEVRSPVNQTAVLAAVAAQGAHPARPPRSLLLLRLLPSDLLLVCLKWGHTGYIPDTNDKPSSHLQIPERNKESHFLVAFSVHCFGSDKMKIIRKVHLWFHDRQDLDITTDGRC